MDFSFTPEQESLRGHVQELLRAVCPPEYAERCDREARVAVIGAGTSEIQRNIIARGLGL